MVKEASVGLGAERGVCGEGSERRKGALRWPAVACGGLRWPAVACGGLHVWASAVNQPTANPPTWVPAKLEQAGSSLFTSLVIPKSDNLTCGEDRC